MQYSERGKLLEAIEKSDWKGGCGLMFDFIAKLLEPVKDTKENELTLGFGQGGSRKEIDQLKGLGEKKGDKHDTWGSGWF